jgi:hypothetical protein
MGGSLDTASAVFRFARQAAASGQGSLRSLVFGLCAAAGECARQVLRGETVQLQWALLEVLWYACRIVKGEVRQIPVVSCGSLALPGLPLRSSGSLDTVVLRLFRVVSQVAEMYRWYDATGREPLEWDGLPEVVALAVLALELMGVDVATLLEVEEREAASN